MKWMGDDFRLEYRMSETKCGSLSNQFPKWFEWSKYFKSYKTEKSRITALKDLSKNCKTFEYRINDEI